MVGLTVLFHGFYLFIFNNNIIKVMTWSRRHWGHKSLCKKSWKKMDL